MYKYLLILFFLFLPFVLVAQANSDVKYLQGAVPEIDGKVVFTKVIKPETTIPDEILFQLVSKWVENNYGSKNTESNNRILLSDSDNKKIACSGVELLDFKSKSFSKDKANMSYQFLLAVENGECTAVIRNIKYDHSHGAQQEKMVAEDVITDKHALNEDGTKLLNYYDKFRKYTIDTVDDIFFSLEDYIDDRKPIQVKQEEKVAQSVTVTTDEVITVPPSVISAVETIQAPKAESLSGYKNIITEQIPVNYVQLLHKATLITSGIEGELNTMTASWGGIGVLWEQPVAFCFLNPTRFSINTMDKGDVYTISFFTDEYKEALTYCGTHSGRNTDKIKHSGLTPISMPSGATSFSEAWMIIECKKIVSQQIREDAVSDKPLSEKWSSDGYHKIYIGQILNVWIKN